jgi:predicted GIY-YIG superfamily endonuclease
MTNKQTIKWPGESGTEYVYFIYPRGTRFDDGQPGNYIHVIETSPNRFKPVYIGQTNDLNRRLTNHEKQQCVDSRGASHLCVRVNAGERARLLEEEDLIRRWNPACNTQYCE